MSNFSLQGQTSARLEFHSVSEADFDAWLPFYQDPRCSTHWVWTSAEEPAVRCQQWFASQRYREANHLGGLNTLREKGSGTLVGYCGLLVQTVDELPELEIGYSLLPTHWGRGYATEAALTCKAFANIHRLAESVISIISRTNVPSQRVALNLGMHVEKVTWYAQNEVSIFRVAMDGV